MTEREQNFLEKSWAKVFADKMLDLNHNDNEIVDGEREDEEKPERSRDDRDSR